MAQAIANSGNTINRLTISTGATVTINAISMKEGAEIELSPHSTLNIDSASLSAGNRTIIYRHSSIPYGTCRIEDIIYHRNDDNDPSGTGIMVMGDECPHLVDAVGC